MVLFLIGFLIGGFLGILLMTILAVSKREYKLMENLLIKNLIT